jgi:hypothetical protein
MNNYFPQWIDARTLRAISLLLIVYCGVIFFFYAPVIHSGSQYDDSYITYRYAVNLVERGDLTFNSYDRVNSASSLLYTLVLAGFYAIGFHDLESVAMGIGVSCGIITIIFAALLAQRISRRPWLTGIFLLPVAISGSYSGWAVSGMETIPYAALIMCFFYYYASNRFAVALWLMALCLIARPEGIILLVAVAMTEISKTDIRANYGRLVKFLMVGGCTFGLWVIWNRMYYGTALPNPVLLKQVALYYSPTLLKSTVSVAKYFIGSFGMITIPGVLMSFLIVVNVVAGWFIKRKVYPRLPSDNLHVALSIFAFGSIASFLLGPSSDFNRYMVHLLPIFALLSLSCLELFIGPASTIGRLAANFSYSPLFYAGIAILLIGSFRSLVELQDISSFFNRTVAHQDARKKLGEYIEQHVPTNQLIISSDLGAIAYVAKRHDFLDVFGLTSKEPVVAIHDHQWESYIQDLKTKKPQWVADTGAPDGKISSFEILAEPYKIFRGGSQNDKPYINMYSPRNQIVLQFTTEEGYVFRLVKIDAEVYN